MSKSVLLLKDALDAAKVSAIEAACAQIDAILSVALSSDPLPNPATYDLYIAGLAKGERQISDAICELLSDEENVSPLLMLCDEPLVRSHVSLQDARVNLLSNPLSEEMLVGSIHRLMDGVQWTADDLPTACPETPMSEAWGHHYWACRISPQKDEPALIYDKRSNGVLACFGRQDSEALGTSLLTPIETLSLDRESGVDEAMKSVSGFGTLASLNTQNARWTFDVNNEECKLFLTSPQRSPHTFEITDNRSMWAAPGDLVMIIRDGEAVCDDATFNLACQAGGQVVARKLRKEQERVGDNFACLFLEVIG